MFITKIALDEFMALPVHTRAKVIRAIDQHDTNLACSPFIQLRDNLIGIYTEVSSVQRIIFFYRTDAGTNILGILLRKNKKLMLTEQDEILRRADEPQEQDVSKRWSSVRQIALGEPEVKTAFENEVLKETLQTTLLKWRSAAGLTREQLAEKMGVSFKHICNIEINPSKISIHTIYQYARFCGINNPAIIL